MAKALENRVGETGFCGVGGKRGIAGKDCELMPLDLDEFMMVY